MTPEEVKDAAELEVRRYFDHYLKDIHPKIMQEHFHACKHGIFLNRFKWVMLGMLITIAMLFPAIGGQIIDLLLKTKGV